MRRRLPLLVGFAILVSSAATCLAGDPKPPPAPPPKMATDADAAIAIAKFKEDYKAKGLKGDDKLSQRDFALRALAKLQHLTIVDAIGVVSRDPDPTLRMLGVVYLGDQSLLPGAAGMRVAAALDHASGDEVMVLTSLQAIGRLRYLGARPQLRDMLKEQSFAVKKAAIDAVGRTGDLRLIKELVAVVGLDLGNEGAIDKTKDSGGKEVVSEGASWEGAEAHVDTGAAGDTDQRAAEAEARAQIAANRAAAESSRGSGGGGGGGGEAGQGGKGGTARSTAELLPNVLAALRRMTERTFASPGAFRKWHAESTKLIEEKTKELDAKEKEQKALAK